MTHPRQREAGASAEEEAGGEAAMAVQLRDCVAAEGQARLTMEAPRHRSASWVTA